MAKELIISANVHEKKVAIIEDGVVTEFYVERRDENQGVVGNLYKGRVMKVLPGMQSAFVDIGLDRDAFLYVSDFTEFIEDEELDFRSTEEEGKAIRTRQPDRPGRGGRPVPVSPAGSISRVQDERPSEIAPPAEVSFEDVVEQLAEIADESVIPPPTPDEDSQATAVGEPAASVEEFAFERVSDDRPDAIGELAEPVAAPDQEGSEEPAAGESQEAELQQGPPARRGRPRKKSAEPGAPRKATRSRKKGARSEASVADTEAGGGTQRERGVARRKSRSGQGDEVASEPSELSESDDSSFERITDEDSARAAGEYTAEDAGELLKDAIVQEKIIERVHHAEFQTSPLEPEPEWRIGSLLSQMSGATGLERISDEASETAAESADDFERHGANDYNSDAVSSDGIQVEPFKHFSQVFPSELYERVMSGGMDPEARDMEEASVTADEPGQEDQEEDSEASRLEAGSEPETGEADEGRSAEVRDRGSRAEFAIRRGGRGRRRRREPQTAAPTPQPEEAKPAVPAQAEEAEVEDRKPPPLRARAPRRQEERHERRGDGSRKPEAGPIRKDRGFPTISDLLHESQEILVQIAKEPIAKKGARITSHIALPGRYLVYMPTVNHVGVSRKIASDVERVRLKRVVSALREKEGAGGGFIARTACAGHSEQELHDDMRYLLRTWNDVRKKADRDKAPALVHRDLDLVQRILRDQLSDQFTAIRVDNDLEYAQIVEFVNRVQPKLVKRVKLYVGDSPIFEKYGVQPEIDKAVKPRVWLKSGGYIVINQTEALVAIDVNTGKFVGKSDRLEDTITRTNLEAAKEIVRQVRLRDLGGIIVIDFIDMEERKNRQRVMLALQQELQTDRAPSKILSINDFGLVAITRKRVKQSLERTLCTPCPYCQGAGMVKSPQTICFEILEQAKAMSKQIAGSPDIMLRVSRDVAEAFRTTEREVLEEIEAYFGTPVTIEADPNLHQEQYDFAVQ